MNRNTFAKSAITAAVVAAIGGGLFAPSASALTGSSSDLVEVTSQPASFIGSNSFKIANVANRTQVGTTGQMRMAIPAGTRFVIDSSNFLNIALGSYAGYTLSALSVNGRNNVVVTLTSAISPGFSRSISLGQVQVALATTWTLRLDDYSNQPKQTKDALYGTERRNALQSQYLNNNKSGITCLAAVAPLLSLCSATSGGTGTGI